MQFKTNIYIIFTVGENHVLNEMKETFLNS